VIGEQQVVVTVLEVKGGRVRLGIEAPSNVAIRRKEITSPDEKCLPEQTLTSAE
jgi:carbon storage regulator CsrA